MAHDFQGGRLGETEMTRKLGCILILLLAATSAIGDDNVCPCIPLSHSWVVTACETWTCAQAAMVLANGDPFVMSMPTNDTKYGWIVARRVVTGTAITSPDSPYIIESNASFAAAAAQFSALDPNMLPMIVTASDGVTLLIRLREAAPMNRRRSVAH
jgi:hypothetical protein